ncbi:MAG: hypothetical protein ACYC61_24350 [Isosphaeraceae bacterium]
MEGRISRVALRAEYRRRVFQVFNGDEWMCSYGDMYFMQPEASNRTRDYSLKDVIEDLVRDFEDPGGTDARDMAVWRDGRILAVIRKGHGGRPEVIEFEAET